MKCILIIEDSPKGGFTLTGQTQLTAEEEQKLIESGKMPVTDALCIYHALADAVRDTANENQVTSPCLH